MKIVHLSYSDIIGGASRATYRLHKMLSKNGIDSSMWVDLKKSEDASVFGPDSNIRRYFNTKRPYLRFPINIILNSKKFGMHSPSILPSNWLERINSCDADIIHLHWVQGEMISIKEISKIKKPLVWTFHDMWPFCGCEHYAYNNRYLEGYRKDNLSKNEKNFFDINRFRWNQKIKFFKKSIQIISPSRWMTDCVKKSQLMKNWPVVTIPHPIDVNEWKPLEKKLSRKEINLPQNSKLIMFGAISGVNDNRKGFNLLKSALKNLEKHTITDRIEIVIFGGGDSVNYSELNFKIHKFNLIDDDRILQKLYSAADVMIVPSKMETFGLTALESISCGTPVVAFEGTGLSDIVVHKKTGYLAKYLDEKDFLTGINWVINHSLKEKIDENSRKRAENFFSNEVILDRYKKVYNNLLQIN